MDKKKTREKKEGRGRKRKRERKRKENKGGGGGRYSSQATATERKGSEVHLSVYGAQNSPGQGCSLSHAEGRIDC